MVLALLTQSTSEMTKHETGADEEETQERCSEFSACTTLRKDKESWLVVQLWVWFVSAQMLGAQQ